MTKLHDYSVDFKKFNLGCGLNFVPGYLNVGFYDDMEAGKLYPNPNGVRGAFFLNHDLAQGIPAADNSLDVVYHSHMLEHLSAADGEAFIKACFRVLKPGGLLRVIVPDLELWARNYVSGDTFFFDTYRSFFLKDDREKYPTNGSVFMGMLHNWGHKMGYDFDTLSALLRRTGFERLRRTLTQQSDLPDIWVIEPYDPGRAFESLCVECYKPA